MFAGLPLLQHGDGRPRQRGEDKGKEGKTDNDRIRPYNKAMAKAEREREKTTQRTKTIIRANIKTKDQDQDQGSGPGPMAKTKGKIRQKGRDSKKDEDLSSIHTI